MTNPSEAPCYGVGVYVGGDLVAWFPEFGEKEREWCTENYFGRWLTWRATAPEHLPLTEKEQAEADRNAAELMEKLGWCDEAP